MDLAVVGMGGDFTVYIKGDKIIFDSQNEIGFSGREGLLAIKFIGQGFPGSVIQAVNLGIPI